MVTVDLNTQDVYNLIAGIPDPEIPVITIKDLGILRDVKLVDDTCIVTITPTYTACPAMGMIEGQIKEILSAHGIDKVKVELTYTPAWTTDWLSQEAKAKLKNYGIAPPNHSSCSKLFSTAEVVICPQCNSKHTTLISRFGSTACKALYKCEDCKETFDLFKCH
ncbi:MAG: phenylacetate-CoA oxygenase subunit PaaJ [Sphingobacteriaceae bacterium]|nr:phenylacetate-CoA oxygenase subunit PaaJ [Sphingobacteriaceae bacterium]